MHADVNFIYSANDVNISA